MTLKVVPPKPAAPGNPPVDSEDSAVAGGSDDEVWLPFQRLDVYQVAREFVRLVHQAKITDAELRDQATRAAKRTFLGLCEGLPLEGQGLRRKYFNEANGSLHETLGVVDLAGTIQPAREDDALAIQRLGARLKHMVRALLH